MQHIFDPLLFFFFFFIYITISYAAAGFVKNPDFEIPPANVTANATSLLTGANAIPGWSLNGTVWYVASGGNSSFPDNGGHAVQLGQNGKINQTIKATGNSDGVLDYIVSFTLAAQNIECANNRTALNITLRDSRDYNVSKVIYFEQNSSRTVWEKHSLKMPQMGGDEYLHIDIQSVANATCWPLVDAFAVNTNVMPRWYNGNWLSNGGLEVGPAFVKNTGNGIILSEEEEAFYSPLQQWSILGSIRYIDWKHYKVPRGEAAVELLSGDPSGISQDISNLPTAYTYTLNFTMGDANDSCVADFVVYVQVGSSVYNFTMKSNGRGSALTQTLIFKVEALSSITFYSFKETRTRDGVLCGPVLDDIYLTASFGERLRVCNGVFLLILFVAFMMMLL